MIRATTGGVLKTYRRNLMNSFIGKNNAMTTVLTQRTFNSYAEDPATAAKAFRLRKSRMTVSAQYDVCSDTLKKYDTGFQCLQSIDGLLDTKNGSEQMNTLKKTTLQMLNDPEGDARTQLAKALNVLSETIIQDMNQKYGDHFIFAGADGQNVPFEIKEVDGVNKLYYRGVPVDASEPELMDDAGTPVEMPNGDYVLASADLVDVSALPALEDNGTGSPITVTANGVSYYVADNATPLPSAPTAPADPDDYTEVVDGSGNTVYYQTSDLVDQAKYDATMNSVAKNATTGVPVQVTVNGKTYYVPQDSTISQADYETAKSDAAKLKYLVDEKKFVDIGLGFQENAHGELIESSGFNAALNGLTFLGYGLDEDGDPKNIYSIVQQLKEIAENVPEEGEWDKPTYDKFYGLVQKLEAASSDFKTEFTNMAANVTKLENNQQLLEDNYYNLTEQYGALEDVDMVEAISSFLWAEYAYNAALKVGSSVLSESLMDYLN